MRLNRSKDVEVRDSFEFESISAPIVENLITPCEVRPEKAGVVVMRDSKTGTELLLEYNVGKFEVDVENIELRDEKLMEVWGSWLYRIRLISKETAKQDKWVMKFSLAGE